MNIKRQTRLVRMGAPVTILIGDSIKPLSIMATALTLTFQMVKLNLPLNIAGKLP